MSDFQTNLRKYREGLGITAKDFAAQIGLNYTTYANYENRGKEPKYDTLCKIASALGVSIDDLLDFTPDKAQYWCTNFPASLLSARLEGDNVVISAEDYYLGEDPEVTLSKEAFVSEMERIEQEVEKETAANRKKMFELSIEHYFLARFVWGDLHDIM
jgi:transcriptional regulator with XRE-family HTH domain